MCGHPIRLDGSEHTLDSDIGGDTGFDLASRMNMMMSMIVGLTNKVNGQEEASPPWSTTVHLSSCTSPRGSEDQITDCPDPGSRTGRGSTQVGGAASLPDSLAGGCYFSGG